MPVSEAGFRSPDFFTSTKAKVKYAYGGSQSAALDRPPRYGWKSFTAAPKPIFIAPQM